MENFSILLLYVSLIIVIVFIVRLVIGLIKKNGKKRKNILGIVVGIILFVVSMILFGIFETPESKEKYEQQRIEKQLEKEAKEKQKETEKAEKEKKKEAEKAEKEKQKEEEKAEKEKQKEEEKAEKEKQKETEKVEKQKESKKDEKASKKKTQEKQDSKSNEEEASKNNNSSSNQKSTENIELNYLKQLKTRENPVMNGVKTERIGTYGFVKAQKDLMKEVSESEYIDFCNERVSDSGYNWFTIDFGDGTGIVFAGSFSAVGTYGYIDEERCITNALYYITINEGNTVSVSESTY